MHDAPAPRSSHAPEPAAKGRQAGRSFRGGLAGVFALREGAARRVAAAAIGAGAVLLAGSAVLAARDGSWWLIAVDCLAFLAALGLGLARGIDFRRRAAGIVALGFLFGAWLLAANGPGGAGDLWLFVSVVLAAFFFGARAGLLVGLAGGLLFVVLAFANRGGRLGWVYDPAWFVILGLNVLGIAVIASTALDGLVEGLRKAGDAEDALNGELGRREAELAREAASRRSAEELLEFYRDYDGLTRLPNRQRLQDELEALIPGRGRRGLVLLAVGLPRLGRLTGERGHGAAEALLVHAAAALRGAFRDEDLVARLGPESFAVLCRDARPGDPAVVERAARALGASLTACGEDPNCPCFGTATLAALGGGHAEGGEAGIRGFGGEGDAEGLVDAAELALEAAREEGPGSLRAFDAALRARMVERGRLERELAAALRSGGLETWFQPKYDRSGRIVGAEALARWKLADGSMRPPADFIPVAERTGGIEALGRLVLGRSCRAAAAWSRAGLPPIPVSVNLSPFQFRSPSLVADVRSALADSGLSPYRLELEITESGLADREEDSVDKLAELKSLGISISIDDFGTGYSSISKLRDLPIDTLKMPKEFIDHLPEDPRASMIARAVIDLAHNLRFDVVAEGVESRSQFEWLERAFCDQYQGYYFSPALPPEDFERALASGASPALSF